METILLTKLLLSHLLADFFFKSKRSQEDRKSKKFGSGYLYLHTLITGLLTWVMIGWNYWIIAVIIFVTHTVIDGWKSYRTSEPKYFFIEQLLHIIVILACWWFTFHDMAALLSNWKIIRNDTGLWIIVTAFLFLILPSSYLIGQVTKKWRSKLLNPDDLENAGKWIGIIERCTILVLILQNQYEAIGLLIAAKGLIRFNESDRTEAKTEYLLIGTLISICMALVTGLVVIELMKQGVH